MIHFDRSRFDKALTAKDRKLLAAGSPFHCPFCGSHSIQILESDELCWVNCMTCEADGPPQKTMGQAIDAWNGNWSGNKPE